MADAIDLTEFDFPPGQRKRKRAVASQQQVVSPARAARKARSNTPVDLTDVSSEAGSAPNSSTKASLRARAAAAGSANAQKKQAVNPYKRRKAAAASSAAAAAAAATATSDNHARSSSSSSAKTAKQPAVNFIEDVLSGSSDDDSDLCITEMVQKSDAAERARPQLSPMTQVLSMFLSEVSAISLL
jgi:hypothetical protein